MFTKPLKVVLPVTVVSPFKSIPPVTSKTISAGKRLLKVVTPVIVASPFKAVTPVTVVSPFKSVLPPMVVLPVTHNESDKETWELKKVKPLNLLSQTVEDTCFTLGVVTGVDLIEIIWLKFLIVIYYSKIKKKLSYYYYDNL